MELPADRNNPEWQSRTAHVRRDTGDLSPVLEFSSDDTAWNRRILRFLIARPDSSLLAIVQDFWPDFLAIPADRRASMWFWMKDRLRMLREAGVLSCREDEAGVALWSVVS